LPITSVIGPDVLKPLAFEKIWIVVYVFYSECDGGPEV
jgi:hypothetical protein